MRTLTVVLVFLAIEDAQEMFQPTVCVCPCVCVLGVWIDSAFFYVMGAFDPWRDGGMGGGSTPTSTEAVKMTIGACLVYSIPCGVCSVPTPS